MPISRHVVVIIALAIAVAILGALCGWFYVQLIDRESAISRLSADVGRLQGNKTYLETQLALYSRWLEDNKTEVARLRSVVAEKDSIITSLRSQVAQLQDQVSYLQNRVRDLEDIVYLRKYVVWVDRMVVNQPPRYYTYWRFNVDYAGYVVVEVHSSTTTKTYVEVVVKSTITSYSFRVDVGSSGKAIIPVLPGTVEVRVGNENIFTGATHTISVIYYY